MLQIQILSSSYAIALGWMPQNLTDDILALVEVKALCH